MLFFLIFLPLSPPFVFSLTAKCQRDAIHSKGIKKSYKDFPLVPSVLLIAPRFLFCLKTTTNQKQVFKTTQKKIKSYDAYIPGFISDVCFFLFLNRQNIPEIRRQNLSSILRVGEKATCDRSLIKLLPGVFIKRQNRYRLPPCGFIYFKASSSLFCPDRRQGTTTVLYGERGLYDRTTPPLCNHVCTRSFSPRPLFSPRLADI